MPIASLGLSGASKKLAIRRIEFGNLAIVGLSAEAVVDYLDKVQSIVDPKVAIPVGCIDDTYGYLPTEAMVPDGGYEVDGFQQFFGLDGKFSEGFEQLVLDAVRAESGESSDSPQK